MVNIVALNVLLQLLQRCTTVLLLKALIHIIRHTPVLGFPGHHQPHGPLSQRTQYILNCKTTMVNHRADVCLYCHSCVFKVNIGHPGRLHRCSDSRFVGEAVWRVGGHQLSKYRDQNENQHRQELQESCEVVLHREKVILLH